MKPIAWIGIGLALAAGGFLGGMQFERWRAGNPPVLAAPSSTETPLATPDTSHSLATLVVSTKPVVRVTVRVDGRARQGRSPVVFANLVPGKHELVVERPGFRRHREEIELGAGERRDVLITLRDELGLFYRDNLIFPSMRVEVYRDEIDGRIVGVFGRVENRGKRIVNKIQLRLRFLDNEGRVRHEEFVHPLLSGTQAGDKPLPPGAAHDFAIKAPRVPAEHCCEHIDWAVSLIDVK
jgi:hypothetical protein